MKQDDGNFVAAHYLNKGCLSALPDCSTRIPAPSLNWDKCPALKGPTNAGNKTSKKDPKGPTETPTKHGTKGPKETSKDDGGNKTPDTTKGGSTATPVNDKDKDKDGDDDDDDEKCEDDDKVDA